MPVHTIEYRVSKIVSKGHSEGNKGPVAELCSWSLMTLIYLDWNIWFQDDFWMHLWKVSRAASLRLGSWGNLDEYSMIGRFVGDDFCGLPCLFWSTILQCGARLQIHTLNYWSQCARFLINWGVFECFIARRRSVAVLCMLYKIRCKPMHSPYGSLPVTYVPERVTCGAFVTHRYTYSPPRCCAAWLLLPSMWLWNDLVILVFDGVGLAGFKSIANTFLFLSYKCVWILHTLLNNTRDHVRLHE